LKAGHQAGEGALDRNFAGAKMPHGGQMPEIIIYLAEGRSIDAKRAVVKDITDTIVKNFKVSPEAVAIHIVEAPRENKAKGGLLFIDRK
jgi:4-oxalocrotonate tautomerase